jgi:HK97 family phage major capsid protein/HK97 family phage prohead protease
MIHRAYSILDIKAVRDDDRVIEGIASTPTPDRVGDVVEPMGVKFKLPMPLLWQHDSRSPVGNVTFAKATKDGIPFRATIAKTDEPGRLKDRLDEAWQSLKLKLVRAVSIGFSINAYEILKEGGWRITDWEWLELSLVTIPANAEATITSIRSIDRALLAASGKAQRTSNTPPGASGNRSSRTEGNGIMNPYAEKIAALEKELAPKRDRMEAILKAAADDGDRKLDSSEAEEFDTLESEVAEGETTLRRYKALDRSAKTAKAVGEVDTVDKAAAARSDRLPAEAKKKDEPGIGFARMAMCLAAAKGDPFRAIEVAKSQYPGLTALQTVLKSAVSGHTTSATDLGSAFIDPLNYVGDFVEVLRPRTIVGRFGANGIPSLRRVPFNIKVPVHTGRGEGYWTGESRGKGVTNFTTTSLTLRWTKVANIAVVSKDMIRFAKPSAEMFVRDALLEALQYRLDADFADPDITAIEDVRPAAITNGATTYVASGIDADAVRFDLGKLFAAFTTANIGTSDNVLLMREAQANKLLLMRNALGQREFPDITRNGGFLEGVPVIVSQHVPSGLVVLVAAGEIYLADDGQATVDFSTEASLEMDTAPTNTPASITASPPTPAGASLVSMFQTNNVAFLAERMIHWRRRHDAGVAYLTAVGWGGNSVSPIVPN